MLSHVLKMGPGLSLSTLSPHLAGLLLEFLRAGDIGLQAAVMEAVLLLLDLPWWSCDVPVEVLWEEIAALACGYPCAEGGEGTRALWEATFGALLRELALPKAGMPVGGSGARAHKVGEATSFCAIWPKLLVKSSEVEGVRQLLYVPVRLLPFAVNYSACSSSPLIILRICRLVHCSVKVGLKRLKYSFCP
jgi:hypothetical protein